MPKRSFILTLLAVAGGCSQDPVIPKLDQDPVTLTLSVSSRTLRSGVPDTITVLVKNTLTQKVQLQYGFSSDCQVEVRIRDAAGNVVLPAGGKRTCPPITSTLDILAGGTVTKQFVWDGRTTFLPTTSTEVLPVGTYFVSAEINALNYTTFVPAIKVDITQ